MRARVPPLRHLADSILYISSLLRPERRAIDRYIDYFGDRTPQLALRTVPFTQRPPRAVRPARA